MKNYLNKIEYSKEIPVWEKQAFFISLPKECSIKNSFQRSELIFVRNELYELETIQMKTNICFSP